MASIVTNLTCELTAPVSVVFLPGNMFSMDNGGNIINVFVVQNGEPVALGGSVSANVIRSDGTTVAITGALEGNKAYIILPQACYAVPGIIHIVMKITEGTTITTIAAVTANVYQSSTDAVVDPGTLVPSIAALIEAIEDAVDSIPVDYSGLLATLAADYSTSKTYKVGDYAWYGGVLKRCIVAITTAESYTAAHWTNAVIGDDLSALKSAIDDNAYQHIQMIQNNDIWKIFQTLASVRSGSKAYAENKTAITISSDASLNSYFQAFLLNPVPAYVSSPYVDDTLVIDMEYSTDFTNLYLVLYGESSSDRERIVLESGNNKHIRLSAKLNVPTYIYLWTNDGTQVSKSITIKNVLMYYGNPAINPQMFIKNEDGNDSGVIHRALIIAPNSSISILRPVEDLNRHGFATELTTYGNFYRHYIEWFDSFDVLVINNSSYSGAIPVWETTSPAQAILAIKYWMEHGKKVIYYALDRTNRITKLKADGTLVVGSLDTLFPITITRELNATASAEFEYADDCPSGLSDCINTEFPTAQNVVYSITGTGLVNVVDVVDGDDTYHACVVKPGEYAVVGLAGSGTANTVGTCRYVDIGALATELVGGSGASLAQDMANGKRIVAFGIDGDITTDKTAVDVFTQSFFTTPIEVGLRTALLDDSLGEAYRETPGNARFCTHGKYHSTNALTNREETHTIPSSLFVFLDYYCFAAASYELTSVTSEDGTVTYSPVNLGTTVTEGHYLLDRTSGIISFASADQGKTIKIKYSPLDEGKDWIPSVPELNQYNLQSTDCIYLTSHQHAISGQTYQQAEQRGYIMSDHIDQVERCNHFMGRGLLDKVVPLTNPTWVNPNTLTGYDGEVYDTTQADALATVLPNAVARVEKWNQPLMWYSHDYTTNNGDTRCLYGGTRFNADWSKATYAETIASLREFFTSLRTYIGEHNGVWITRSSHAVRYTLLQKYVKWNDSDRVIIASNTGDKPITGVTFRKAQNGEPTKVVDQDGNAVQYTYNSGSLLLWFDLAPGERKEITIC